MELYEICKLDDCTGCGACSSVCPTDSIKIILDIEGFLKYSIDEGSCIICGLCKNICPANQYLDKKGNIEPKTFLCWNYDDSVRIASSSGGIFSVIANEIFKNEGVVVGARFDDNFNVIHDIAYEKKEIIPFRGSKYIQSMIGDTLKNVKKILDSGRIVLFSGTPCQVAGLYSFLGKNYDNLLTIDFICHGTSSIKLFHDTISFFESKFKSKLAEVRFRDKKTGWKDSSSILKFKSGAQYADLKHLSIFTYGFAVGFTNNKVCGHCKHALIPRRADITLGDYGADDYKTYSKSEIKKGMSLLIINSKKGEKCFNEISDKIYYGRKTLDLLIKNQMNIIKSPAIASFRNKFFEEYVNNGFLSVKNYLKAPLMIRFKYFIGIEKIKLIKNFIKQIIGRSN